MSNGKIIIEIPHNPFRDLIHEAERTERKVEQHVKSTFSVVTHPNRKPHHGPKSLSLRASLKGGSVLGDIHITVSTSQKK